MYLIGRKAEQEILQDCLLSKRPEFLLVYGRRRIGKTYLIKEFFNNEFSFYATGVPGEKTRDQLKAFNEYLKQYGSKENKIPKDWMEAFHRLRQLLERKDVRRNTLGNKRVIFLDEMPWMATAKSDFKTALDLFWNGWASSASDILLIVCGSAASWVIDNILLDSGGMYNRITQSIHLMPFSLQECRSLLVSGGHKVSDQIVMEYYMIFGGVPYYINMLNPRLSVAQNTDRLVFNENGSLRYEYDNLFRSLFRNSEKHIAVIREIGSKKNGVLRGELLNNKHLPDGETLTRVLRELEQCGFIRKYTDYTTNGRGFIYQMTDPFLLFALKFLSSGKTKAWIDYMKSPSYNAWKGNAFELICLNHISQIKKALGISGISTMEYAWRSKKSSPGVQIDLLIDRKDDIINLCEMKYSDNEFAINSPYEKELRNKEEVFRLESKTRKAVHITMVTSNGLKHNSHWQIVMHEITAADLFM